MKNQWKYKQAKPIKSFKDLERELERAELHQKFLTEIIDNDKALMKKAVSLPNLVQNGIMAISQNSEGKSNILENNLVFSIAKWIVKKFF